MMRNTRHSGPRLTLEEGLAIAVVVASVIALIAWWLLGFLGVLR